MTSLPAPLAPWAAELSILEPRFAASLGPLLRVLDDLTSRHDHDTADAGMLDGYSGITLRGIPERVLASEWALADEFPMEFLRRAASGELLYTAPAYQAERKRGRVAVLVDAGPDQLGAGRLVQLAALIVLHRRANARGGEFVIGMLGDKPGTWRDGGIRGQLRTWLTGRTRYSPQPSDVDSWAAGPDEMWLLTGPRLAALLPARPNMLISTEARWDDEGATAVRVTLDEVTTELALPDRRLSIKALRGAAFHEDHTALASGSTIRFVTFPSADHRLLARGTGPDELVAAYVPDKPKQVSKLRRYQLPGPVVAALCLGGRIVALVVVNGELRGHVIGKNLGRVRETAEPVTELVGIDVDQAVEDGLGPLFYRFGRLVTRLGDAWWVLDPGEGPARRIDNITLFPGTKLDEPRAVTRGPNGVFADGRRISTEPEAHVVLGGHTQVATSLDGITWTVGEQTITVDDGSTVLGLCRLHDVPTLITVSRSGLIVRAESAGRSQTLSKWSAGESPVMHPVMPWIAVRRSATAVDVGDLASGEVLLRVRSG